MKVKIQNDLWYINILNAILILFVAFLPYISFRIILGLPFIFFFPGYVTISALYPTNNTISSINRIVLSFALSLAIVPLMLLALNYTRWGIKLNPIIYSISIFIAIVSIIAWIRRRRHPKMAQFRIEFNVRTQQHKDKIKDSIATRLITAILIISILVTIGSLIFIGRTSNMSENYTEFYALGSNHEMGNYPTKLISGETATITIGINNHEKRSTTYRIQENINGLRVLDVATVTLKDGEKWEESVGFTFNSPGGGQSVEFYLYKNQGTETSQEPLRLIVDVVS